MAALVQLNFKKEYDISIFDKPEYKGEDRHINFTGRNKIKIDDTVAIELLGVFDGHGGMEASEFLRTSALDIINDLIWCSDINSLILYEPLRIGFIKTYVENLNNKLCEFLVSCNNLSKDPGSTLSMYLNFLTPVGTFGYLITVGDSPIFAIDITGQVFTGKIHDIIDDSTRKEAVDFHEDIEVLSQKRLFNGKYQQITTISVRESNVVESVQSYSIRHKTMGHIINVPRAMGHIKWKGSLSHEPDILPVKNIKRVIIMSDGVSDMIIDNDSFIAQANLLNWDAQDIGDLYLKRWYQDWIMLWHGEKYEKDCYDNPHKIAIKGSSKQIADDMTLICATCNKVNQSFEQEPKKEEPEKEEPEKITHDDSAKTPSKEKKTECTWKGVPLDELTDQERNEMKRQELRKENSMSSRRTKYRE